MASSGVRCCWICAEMCEESYGRNMMVNEARSQSAQAKELFTFVCYECVPSEDGAK